LQYTDPDKDPDPDPGFLMTQNLFCQILFKKNFLITGTYISFNYERIPLKEMKKLEKT